MWNLCPAVASVKKSITPSKTSSSWRSPLARGAKIPVSHASPPSNGGATQEPYWLRPAADRRRRTGRHVAPQFGTSQRDVTRARCEPVESGALVSARVAGLQRRPPRTSTRPEVWLPRPPPHLPRRGASSSASRWPRLLARRRNRRRRPSSSVAKQRFLVHPSLRDRSAGRLRRTHLDRSVTPLVTLVR